MKPPYKVVTLTLNPALDLTGSLEQLNTGGVNLIESGSLHAAGKGINVAKVLAELGAEVTVSGFLGNANQSHFTQLFASLKLNDQFIRVTGDTRINVKIVENSGQVSDLNFPGITITEKDLDCFENKLAELAKHHDIFVIAGSLPAGIAPERCAKWIKGLQETGKKVFFDSSNAALAAGIQSSPYLIKPNDHELSCLIKQPLTSTSDIQQAAQQIQQRGCDNVVISLGEKGALWVHQQGWLTSQPPEVSIVSTVGAGDSMVAGLCWGELQQWDKAQTLSFATALATLAVKQIGVGVSNNETLLTMQNRVQIEQSSNEVK